jgi:hypothetical protein
MSNPQFSFAASKNTVNDAMQLIKLQFLTYFPPILMALRSKAMVYSHLVAGITGLNPAEGMDVLV